MPQDNVSRPNSNWYDVPVDTVLDTLNTTADGLTKDEALHRLSIYGPNRMPEPAKRSALIRFLLHFHNILIYVLIASVVITATLGHLADTLVILAVVIANAAIGFVQEGKAEKAMDAISRNLTRVHDAIRRALVSFIRVGCASHVRGYGDRDAG